jgi:hypothetical protein
MASKRGLSTFGTPNMTYSKAPLKQLQTPHDVPIKKPLSTVSTRELEIIDHSRQFPLKEKIKELEESILGADTVRAWPDTGKGRERRPLTRMRSRSVGNLPDLDDIPHRHTVNGSHPLPDKTTRTETEERVEIQPHPGQSKFQQKRNLPLRRMRSKSMDHLPDVSSGRLGAHPESSAHLFKQSEGLVDTWATRVPTNTSPNRERPHAMHKNQSASVLPTRSKQLDSLSGVRARPATSTGRSSALPNLSAASHSSGSALTLMPCCQPEDGILSRAEERVTKQAKSREILKRNEEEMQGKIDSWELRRQQREEAVAERKATRERQQAMLPVVQILLAGAFMLKRLKMERAREGGHLVYKKAASRILRCLPVVIKFRIMRKARAATILMSAVRALGVMPKVRNRQL